MLFWCLNNFDFINVLIICLYFFFNFVINMFGVKYKQNKKVVFRGDSSCERVYYFYEVGVSQCEVVRCINVYF